MKRVLIITICLLVLLTLSNITQELFKLATSNIYYLIGLPLILYLFYITIQTTLKKLKTKTNEKIN